MEENTFQFGSETHKDLEEMRKALEVGYAMGTTDQRGFGATRLESLDNTLKMMVEKEKTSKFWIALHKGKASSTVEEFVTVNKIGQANFYVEGGIPEEYDEDIRREFEQVKYIGAVGKVPMPATVTKSVANNVATVQNLKTIAIIRALDTKSFFANAENVPVEFNGFLTQFLKRVLRPSENIIDLRGKVLNAEILNDVGAIVEANYGDPNNLKGWISVDTFKNYAKELIKTKTFMVGNNEIRDITSVPKTWELGNGSGSLETDLHLKFKGQTHIDDLHPAMNDAKNAFASTHDKAPNTLDANTASCAIEAGVVGQLTAGTYDYCIVPVNQYGAGAGFELTNKVVGADKKVTFTIADNGSPAGRASTCFEIYRKLSADPKTSYRYVKTFKATANPIVDDGSEIPNTHFGFFFDWDFEQTLAFLQLLPLVKMPLATIDDSMRWLQKLYGAPILFNPNKMVLVKNIGSTSW